MLANIPAHIPIHLELASFGDYDLLKEVALALLPAADSLGLNEQVCSLTQMNYSVLFRIVWFRGLASSLIFHSLALQSIIQSTLMHKNQRGHCAPPRQPFQKWTLIPTVTILPSVEYC